MSFKKPPKTHSPLDKWIVSNEIPENKLTGITKFHYKQWMMQDLDEAIDAYDEKQESISRSKNTIHKDKPSHIKKIVLSPKKLDHTVVIKEHRCFSFWIFMLYCSLIIVGFFFGYFYCSFRRDPHQSYYNKYPSALLDGPDAF